MKILLTGTNGFVGKNLKIFLKRNHEIYEIKSFKRKNSNKINKSIFYYDYKINTLVDFFKSFKPDIVIHLASLFLVDHKSEDVKELIDSNVLFSSHLVEAMIQSNCKKIINTGSSWQNFKNENFNPVNLYAATKEAFFKILYFYHLSNDISCINIKLFDTYGKNDRRKKLFYLLDQASKKKSTLDMSEGNQNINLLYIDDICKGFELSINLFKNKKPFFKTYALSAEELISLKNLVIKYLKIKKLNVKINWGKRKKRRKEVLNPWNNYSLLPGWRQEIFLDDGLKKLNEN